MNTIKLSTWDSLNFPYGSFNLLSLDVPYEIGYNKKWDMPGVIDWSHLFLVCKTWMKDNGNFILFTGFSNLSKMLVMADPYFNLQNIITWDRIKTRRAKDKNLTSASEFILWLTPKELKEKDIVLNKEDSQIKKLTGGMGMKNGSIYRRLSNVWTDISPLHHKSEEYTGYNCQKPLALIRRIIRLFSNRGDLVGDFFCGSGTTAEACIIEERSFFCSDSDPEAINLSEQRVQKHLAQVI